MTLDTDTKGRLEAFNPAELLLAAVAACMIKNIERTAPMLKLWLRAVELALHGVRPDGPPKMATLTRELIIDTDADDHRLELLHQHVRQYRTIYDAVAEGARVKGRIIRRPNARRFRPVRAAPLLR